MEKMEKITEEELEKELAGKDFKGLIQISASRAKDTLAVECTCSKDINGGELISFAESCAIAIAMFLEKTGIDRDIARSMVRKAVKNGLKRLNEEA